MTNATGRPIVPLILGSDERMNGHIWSDRFAAIVSRGPRSLSERCRVILRCADGVPSKSVATEGP